MVLFNYTPPSTGSPGAYAELQHILATLDDAALVERLQEYRHTGRPGWSQRALWSAYLASYYLDLPHTNALIRRLQDDPALRAVCGFDDDLPHRTTFNRYIQRLGDHQDLVTPILHALTNQLRELLPGFGEVVAIDSTDVHSHANPDKKSKVTGLPTDPEARWGVAHSVRSKNSESTEYFFGYKVHMVADATHDLPISFKVTAGNRNDSPELPALMDQTFTTYDWFAPKATLADRGYDALKNFEYLYLEHGIDPIIHIRKPTAQDGLYEGVFNANYLPVCLGNMPMEYVGQDGEGQHLFRCRSEGCHLKEGLHAGIRHCDTAFAQDPTEYLRVLGGQTRRGSPEWDALYARRWSVERVFKSLKESRRLDEHCTRGLKQITLHALMATLTYQANALVKVLAGEQESMRWQVRKVA